MTAVVDRILAGVLLVVLAAVGILAAVFALAAVLIVTPVIVVLFLVWRYRVRRAARQTMRGSGSRTSPRVEVVDTTFREGTGKGPQS